MAQNKPLVMAPTDKIVVNIEAPGYRSSIDLPVDLVDKAEAFCGWFKMQLDYLARWKPGSTATIRETKPVIVATDPGMLSPQ